MFKFLLFCFLILNWSSGSLADVVIEKEADFNIENVGNKPTPPPASNQNNSATTVRRAQANPTAVTTATSSVDSTFTINKNTAASKSYYERYPTMMFQTSSIDGVVKVLNNTYVSNATKQGSKTAVVRPKAIEIVSENNLNVYLNSIMFVSVNEWTLWLNGQKITNINNGESEIRVVELGPKRAIFEWSMGLSKWGIVNANENIPVSAFNLQDDRVTMKFSLSPNQTFIPAFNEVIEGKIRAEVSDTENTVESPKVEEAVFSPGENNFYF